jgi:hypothetical protein
MGLYIMWFSVGGAAKLSVYYRGVGVDENLLGQLFSKSMEQ